MIEIILLACDYSGCEAQACIPRCHSGTVFIHCCNIFCDIWELSALMHADNNDYDGDTAYYVEVWIFKDCLVVITQAIQNLSVMLNKPSFGCVSCLNTDFYAVYFVCWWKNVSMVHDNRITSMKVHVIGVSAHIIK